jgi:hypothetical protein
MDKADIPEDEWMPKRAALAEEHRTPSARDSLREGLKAWMQTDLCKQRRSKTFSVLKRTKTIIVADD